MTDAPQRKRRRRPSAYPVIAGSVATFTALFGFLTYQLRVGHDPALGNKVALQQVVAPRRVLVKRIERHVIVTDVVPPAGDDGGGTTSAGGTSAGSTVAAAPTTVQQAPVVVQSAPAPVAAAPAPAPAPVVTKSS